MEKTEIKHFTKMNQYQKDYLKNKLEIREKLQKIKRDEVYQSSEFFDKIMSPHDGNKIDQGLEDYFTYLWVDDNQKGL